MRDLAIMYDKANGQCSGYAFVSYATRQEADSAIAELDDRLTLPGSHSPLRVSGHAAAAEGHCSHTLQQQQHQQQQENSMIDAVITPSLCSSPVTAAAMLAACCAGGPGNKCQYLTAVSRRPCTVQVRYAKNAYGIPLGAGPADNTKLHFSRVPRGVSRDAVVGMFASFDTVVGIEIFRGKNGCSMGLTSGLVTLATHAGAAAARRALDGHVMEGGCAPLKVQWSDPDMQHKKRRAQQAAEGRTVRAMVSRQ